MIKFTLEIKGVTVAEALASDVARSLTSLFPAFPLSPISSCYAGSNGKVTFLGWSGPMGERTLYKIIRWPGED